MQMPAGVNRNLAFLGVTLLIVAGLVAASNVHLTEEAAVSVGMCDTSIHCQGVETAGACIGIEKRQTQCVAPENASSYRWAEAECGLDAQGICNANPAMSGLDWTDHPNATYKGQRCEQWAAQDDRIDLLSCEDTFNDVTQWSGARQRDGTDASGPTIRP